MAAVARDDVGHGGSGTAPYPREIVRLVPDCRFTLPVNSYLRAQPRDPFVVTRLRRSTPRWSYPAPAGIDEAMVFNPDEPVGGLPGRPVSGTGTSQVPESGCHGGLGRHSRAKTRVMGNENR